MLPDCGQSIFVPERVLYTVTVVHTNRLAIEFLRSSLLIWSGCTLWDREDSVRPADCSVAFHLQRFTYIAPPKMFPGFVAAIFTACAGVYGSEKHWELL